MLYHYTKLTTAIEFILPNFELKPNSFFKTNDPRETYLWSFGGMNIIKDSKDPVKASFKIGYDARKDCKLICFCGDKTKYNNEIMWSHYAENHRGVCLQIDENKFLSENKVILDETVHFLKNIKYKVLSEGPLFVIHTGQSHEEAMSDFIKKNYMCLYFQKSK